VTMDKKKRGQTAAATGIDGFEIQKYADGDLCRSLDQGKLYQAKVVKAGEDDQYFIHYQGWNKKWDKWVHASLMMAEGPEAEKYAKKLADAEKKREEAKVKARAGEKEAAGQSRRKKPRIDVGRALEAADETAPQIKLPLPFTLKKQLVDDWESISQMDPHMLVTLPRKPTVSDVISEFLEFKAKRTSTAKQQHLTELLEGLRIYFDNSLPVILLYPQERQQFADITKQHPDVPVSKIYGAEHLLRLFTKLPHVLGKARLASVESAQLQTNLGEFLKYLQKNHATIFLKNYEEYTPLAEGGEASGGGGAAGASSSGNGKEASEGGEGKDSEDGAEDEEADGMDTEEAA